MKQYLFPANILLPKKDFEKWAVIACDQYTSDAKYWNEVNSLVGSTPSALNLVLPEIYLAESSERVAEINDTMKKYLEEGVFCEYENSAVYIERVITGGAIRPGILALIDLEEYEYESGKNALTRATEQTVAERIPPRVEIRRDASIEFPHILLFIDDPDNKVINSAVKDKQNLEKLYDFDLMQNGGHIVGYKLPANLLNNINEALHTLVKQGLLFAVGDGNHSLATAKECHKINGTELSRYALVEVVNIHNPAIEFEPIYRVLFGADKEDVLSFLKEKNAGVSSDETHKFTVLGGADTNLSLAATSKLPVGTLQTYLDEYIALHPEVEIDYIHGIEATRELCLKDNTVGFLFDGMRKDELFDAVIVDGSLPRKTFSMGHADDKRFYIEGRCIK